MINRKSALLQSSGTAALALGAMLVSSPLAAQAFQAIPDSVSGDVTFNNTGTGTQTITVNDLDAVITWVPFTDGQGNALDFLPTNNVATFQGAPGLTQFGVINRILPSANGTMAVMDGTVISQLLDGQMNASPGGFVMFYSSTGLLIGPNATFDVGTLMLTSLAPDTANFEAFVTGSDPLDFNGVSNDSSLVQVSSGATITGTAEGSAFIIAAPQIIMSGDVRINGSTAYIVAQDLNLAYASGLFDIVIPTGTNVASALLHDGSTGGPASTGPGDNHVIYGVGQAQQNPITMLFGGNLGFDTAVSASVENGVIILAANYDVSGTLVTNDLTSGSVRNNTNADLIVRNADVTSDIELESSHSALVISQGGTSVFTGDVSIYAREFAQLISSFDSSFTIAGDVDVSAFVLGNSIPGVTDVNELNAVGGVAQVGAEQAGFLDITGNVFIDASAEMGVDNSNLVVGSAVGGIAELFAIDSGMNIGGDVFISAEASGSEANFAYNSGGNATGGDAYISIFESSNIDIGGSAYLYASGRAMDLPGFGDSNPVGIGQGGNAIVQLGGSFGTPSLDITGDLELYSDASGSSSGSSVGGNGFGGSSTILIADSGNATVGGQMQLYSNGQGGNAGDNSTAGDGTGGQAIVNVDGLGSLTVTGDVKLQSWGLGGDGSDQGNGGNGTGGFGQILAALGTINLLGDAEISASAFGGTSSIGSGGNGGNALGGLVQFFADGTEIGLGTLTIAGVATGSADGFGGQGGDGNDSDFILAGNGGIGEGGGSPNSLIEGGAFISALAQNGVISIGSGVLSADGVGGDGGDGGINIDGGDGGDGIGGTARFDVSLDGFGGSIILGSANFGTSVSAQALGLGGNGGAGGVDGDIADGFGGAGTAGDTGLYVEAATATVGAVSLDAVGQGGFGLVGGDGAGGQAGLLVSIGGQLDMVSIFSDTTGQGGFGTNGDGGTGTGGDAFLDVNSGSTLNVTGIQRYLSFGEGGSSDGGNGGDGIGGGAYVFASSSTINASGSDVVLAASGSAGNAFSTDFTGGSGQGGEAFAEAIIGGSISFGALSMEAGASGGSGPAAVGGNATGGEILLSADGSGSSFSLATNLELDVYADGGDTNGDSGIGGSAFGGSINIIANNSGLLALPPIPPVGFASYNVVSTAQAGSSSVDGGSGGDAEAGFVAFTASNNGTITGDSFFVLSDAHGGSSLDGLLNIAGGAGSFIGTGNAVLIEALGGGSIDLVINAQSRGFGGDGSGTAAGGDGTSGIVLATADASSSLDFGSNSLLLSNARGGFGHTGGFAFAGDALAVIDPGGSLAFDPSGSLFLRSIAEGGDGEVTGGDGTAGDATLFADNASVTGGTLGLRSAATGGTGIGGNAGSALSANSLFSADNGSTVDLVSLQLESRAFGGEGGSGNGGTASSQAAILLIEGGSAFTVDDTIEVHTDSNGGAATLGNAGAAFGGSALISVNGATLAADGNLTEVESLAFGGASFSDNFLSGDSTGGSATILVSNGGTASFFAAVARAGSIGGGIDTLSSSNGMGGDAIGGLAAFSADGLGSSLQVTNESSVEAFTRGGGTQGLIGQPVPTGGTANDGIGGTATGGQILINANNGGSISLLQGDSPLFDGVFDLFFVNRAFTIGGNSLVDGGSGGDASNANATINAANGSAITLGAMVFNAQVTAGSALASPGNIAGGDASGGIVTINATGGSTLDFEGLSIGSFGVGGDATFAAQSGDGTGGLVTVLIDASDLILRGANSMTSSANGGSAGFFGNGFAPNPGNAIGNSATVTVRNSSTVQILPGASLAGSLELTSRALGGTATDGNQGGDATSGAARLDITDSSLTGGGVTVQSFAIAGAEESAANGGGTAISGDAQAVFRGSTTANLDSLSLVSTATSFTGGTATSGFAQLVADGSAASVTSALIDINADASGGTTNTAGSFNIDALNGLIVTDDLLASAVNPDGIFNATNSRLQALGGQIQILNDGTIDVSGNLSIETGLSGLIVGGSDPISLTASFDFFSSGLITISGDNDALPTFGSLVMDLTSYDLEILAGARFGAPDLSFHSNNTDTGAIIGGTAIGAGYTVTNAEAERIEGDNISFFGPSTTGGSTYDVQIRDLTIIGSLDAGISRVSFFSDGSLGVVGNVQYTSADFTDELNFFAAGEFAIELPTGSITVDNGGDNNFAYTGTVNIFGSRIFAASGDLLPSLRSDPDAAGLASLLADDGGASFVDSYLSADTVFLEGSSHILMQNTGAAGTLGGILVGPGGLTIRQFSDAIEPTMRTIAYGMQDLGSGILVTNDDFFATVDFGPNVADEFTPGSTLNDCDIVTGVCGVTPPPPPPPPPPPVEPPSADVEIFVPLTNSDYTELPPEVDEEVERALAQAQADVSFGMDFPKLFNPPAATEQALITDPVTSGGDSSTGTWSGQTDVGEGNQDDK